MVVALQSGRSSWTAPLDALRIGPHDDVTEVTAAQLRQVVERLRTAGQYHDGDPPVLIVTDFGYDIVRLAWLLGPGRQDRPIRPGQPRPADLASQDGNPWRSTSSSAAIADSLCASCRSQPNTRTAPRYSSRTSMDAILREATKGQLTPCANSIGDTGPAAPYLPSCSVSDVVQHCEGRDHQSIRSETRVVATDTQGLPSSWAI
jgi:hypothetical protein